MRLLLAALLALGLTAPLRAQELQPPPPPGMQTAAFAGGCFWCMVHPFQELKGVSLVVSGYTGGHVVNPTYQQVSGGGTGHRESVQVTYDPKLVSYDTLLQVYWRNVDPFDSGGEFCDRGGQYTTAIYAADDAQRTAAEASEKAVGDRFGKKIATVIEPAAPFYRAEDYHQDYYKKNPLHYKFYRYSCGRDARLDEVWGKEARGGEIAQN